MPEIQKDTQERAEVGAAGSARPSFEEQVLDVLRRRMLPEFFPKGALGTGLAKHGETAGVLNAVWSEVKLSGTSSEVEVPHTLGEVPQWVKLWKVSPAPGNTVHVDGSPVRESEWTKTTARMHLVAIGAGSMDGAIALFLVGGR